MKEKKRAFLRRLGVKLIAAAMILLGLTFIADLLLKPVVESVNEYECHAAVSDMINHSIADELEREGAEYSSLVELTRDESGSVCSIESNAMNINRLKNNIADRLNRELERMSSIDLMIPIGTLSGITMLHGKGFDVGMTVTPVGYANTAIISEFTEAGLNQTRHRIIIQISVTVDAVIPGFSSRVPVTTSIIAAETIIVGKVPDAYTHVVAGDTDLVGLLQDYGAVLD